MIKILFKETLKEIAGSGTFMTRLRARTGLETKMPSIT